MIDCSVCRLLVDWLVDLWLCGDWFVGHIVLCLTDLFLFGVGYRIFVVSPMLLSVDCWLLMFG